MVDRPTIICLHIWRFISGNGLHKDEIFGSNTYNAVLDYQRKNNEQANIPGVEGTPETIKRRDNYYDNSA